MSDKRSLGYSDGYLSMNCKGYCSECGNLVDQVELKMHYGYCGACWVGGRLKLPDPPSPLSQPINEPPPKEVSSGNGWECPRCHKIHAPFISGCDCPFPYIIKTATNSQTKGEQVNDTRTEN